MSSSSSGCSLGRASRHLYNGQGGRRDRQVQRRLLLRLDTPCARRDRDLLPHPLGALTVEPAMGPVPEVQQPEHGKAHHTA
jgi:hypothetical protein